MSLKQTESITSAIVQGLQLNHGDKIYVMIRCHNSIDIYSEEISPPVTAILIPPSIQDAYISVYPQKATYYETRENTQVDQSEMEFSYQGFDHNELIEHYEYRINGLNGDQWINVGKQVIIFSPGSKYFSQGNLY